MKRRWLVYAHIVPKEISGYKHDKYYIGITSQKLEERFKNGLGYQRCTLFWKAIQKYGWKNIVHIVLIDNLSRDDANKLEMLFIEHFNSHNPTYGYNITIGGDGVEGYKHSEEIKRIISQRQIGKIPPNKGQRASEETKAKQREAWKKRKRKGGMLGTKKPVIVYPINKQYDSLTDACKDLNLNYHSCVNVIKGRRNSIFGYTFKYVGGYINHINEREVI